MTLILGIAFLYFLLIIWLIIGFNTIKEFKTENNVVKTTFSIIIPFRNEAENIATLVDSLTQLNYPTTNFEILFIDDDSTDNSVLILEKYLIKNNNFKILKNNRKSNSPKKDAIKTAINIAKHKWILTTDADCIVPKKWLQSFNGFINESINKTNNLNMIVAPVAYKTDRSFLQNFQNMDFLSLIGSTIGSFGIDKPFLCNGANLCYRKEIFINLNGFDGNDNIASGDDIFLMEKIIKNHPNTVQFLKTKDVIVVTKPETTFAGLLSQRIRWASKTASTKNTFGKLVGILVFLMNLLVIIGFGFIIFSFLTFQKTQLSYLFTLIVLKISVDFILIQKTYKFLGIKNSLKAYLLSSILYPFFVVCIVFLSFFKKYQWKGRSFDK